MHLGGAFAHHGNAGIFTAAVPAGGDGLSPSGDGSALPGDLAQCDTADAMRSWLLRFAQGYAFCGGRYVHLGHVHPGKRAIGWKPLRFLSTHEDHWLVGNMDPVSLPLGFLPFAWTVKGAEAAETEQGELGLAPEAGQWPDCVTIPVQDHVSGSACLILFGGGEKHGVDVAQAHAPSLVVSALAFHLLAKVIIPTRNMFRGVLSDREITCLRLAAQGETLSSSADRLGVSTRTVELHVSRATKKLNAANKVNAVAIAVGTGLIQV